jgi:hypothetical protein
MVDHILQLLEIVAFLAFFLLFALKFDLKTERPDGSRVKIHVSLLTLVRTRLRTKKRKPPKI